MTVLARSFLHISSTRARALAWSVSPRSSSMYLPWRTSSTPVKPREANACWMARPCGSRTPGFRVMWTLAFNRGPSLHRVRALHVAQAGLRQDAEAAGHLLVGLGHLPEILAEAVLVELLVGLHVPQPAVVRADLVGQDDAHLLVLVEAAELELEVDQPEADAEEQAGEEVVDAQRQRHDVVDVLRVGPAESGDVFFGDHGIAELVGLVVELDDRARQLRALGEAEALGQRPGGDVAHDDLERNDLDLPH